MAPKDLKSSGSSFAELLLSFSPKGHLPDWS